MCDIETLRALRLFVNDRLTAVAEDILAVFVRTIVQYQQQQIDVQHRHGVTSELAEEVAVERNMSTTSDIIDILHPPVCKEEGSAEHQQMSSSPIQEEIKEEHEEIIIPQGAHVSTVPLRSVKSEHNENGETEPLASTSTEHVKTRAGVEYGGTSQPTSDAQLLSSSRPSSPFQIKTPPPCGQSAPVLLRTPAIASPLQPLLVLGRCLKNQCGQCGRIFTSPAALESHVSGHTNLPPFTCRHCGKVFDDNRGLNRHKAQHNGRGHKCEKCGKGFVYKFTLTHHVAQVHSGIKPFVCPYCSKDFVSKAEVQSHTRVHSGETPYHCHLCEKKFKRKMDLNKHLRWHNGEKRYWCPYCDKGFVDSNNLKIHKYTHTGEKPRACPHCPKKFTQSGHLKKHLRTIHKQE